ncbi:uncharacterized protein LOC107268247 [Cephus cinctus]|uniref:Uncharacterized protein LOC107268247 n=1 Tax=Cephus cinctus TaxID=211228 RepID=A0AAJ7FKH5_CEPCN|nr:uncharacterized protein LOC107268247 [Cephus cinctus]
MFMRKIKRVMIIIAIIFIPKSQSIIGYDCKVNNLNITTVSLLQVGTCDLPINKPIVENVEIQLLQLTDFMSTEVLQCKIEIDRTIYYCGMYSHISVVNNGRREYIQETTKEQCQKIHNTRTIQMTLGNIIVGLPMNATSDYPIPLAGKIGNDGSCKGVQYSDPYGSWSDVIVQANVKISVYNFNAVVHLNENRISMPSPSHIQENNSAIKRTSKAVHSRNQEGWNFCKKGTTRHE